jgi:hypothetical protein
VNLDNKVFQKEIQILPFKFSFHATAWKKNKTSVKPGKVELYFNSLIRAGSMAQGHRTVQHHMRPWVQPAARKILKKIVIRDW